VNSLGEKGRITVSIFDDNPPRCITADGTECLDIKHPAHIHAFHVKNIVSHLEGLDVHPSTGESAARTAWVCDQILSNTHQESPAP